MKYTTARDTTWLLSSPFLLALPPGWLIPAFLEKLKKYVPFSERLQATDTQHWNVGETQSYPVGDRIGLWQSAALLSYPLSGHFHHFPNSHLRPKSSDTVGINHPKIFLSLGLHILYTCFYFCLLSSVYAVFWKWYKLKLLQARSWFLPKYIFFLAFLPSPTREKKYIWVGSEKKRK